ncbi:MAG: hypothetical protein FD123_3045 [Bacteroidetes bacterium]|nr:MAG: hypothetical protein FD123_3045 [Bacteroidota bacterium]
MGNVLPPHVALIARKAAEINDKARLVIQLVRLKVGHLVAERVNGQAEIFQCHCFLRAKKKREETAHCQESLLHFLFLNPVHVSMRTKIVSQKRDVLFTAFECR